MNSLVVLFAVCAVACGSYVPLAQPPHYPAVVLDPHGRPLDTAEVINARALHLQAKALEHHAPLAHAALVAPVAHAVLPAAVSHQARYDVHTSHGLLAAPLLAHSYSPLAHAHLLKKRSLGHVAYSAPIIAPSAVSHQSRVDVISSPAVVSHAVAPVVSHAVAPVVSHAVYAAPAAAVSHQSRVDVRHSPAVISHAVAPALYAAPLAHSAYAAPLAHSLYSSPLVSGYSHGYGHLLKKRSLGHIAYSAPIIAPSAVSHQSRVDVISSPAVVSHVAAPVAVAHAAPVAVAPAVYAAPAAVSHQSRVDVISSPAVVSHAVAPVAHSSIWSAPFSRLAHLW